MDKLDAKDTKILSVIADHADLPLVEIARRTHISKDSVKARMERLVKEGYIRSFFPRIDYTKLHHYHFHVFIKFGSILSNENKFVDIVKNNPKVVAVTRIIGEYDYEIQLLAKHNFELYDILDGIIQLARTAITKVHPLLSGEVHEYTMQIKKTENPYRGATQACIPHTPDDKDLRILKILSHNARERLVDIASQIRLSPEIVRYRIKKLRQSGIIIGMHARIGKHKQGLSTYFLLLNIRGQATKGDASFFKRRYNIYSAKSCKGDWNVFINFYARDNAELIATLDTIRSYFGMRLNTATLLIFLDRYKYLPIPEGITLVQE